MKLTFIFIISLLKLQMRNWDSRIGVKIKFILCGIFTYLAFSTLNMLGTTIIGRENDFITLFFISKGTAAVAVLCVVLGYIGLYFSIIASALFTSLLPKR